MLGGRSGLLSHGLHPMSNASLDSRASHDDSDDGAMSKSSDSLSDLGKAFTVMNADFEYN
jgi:hypothetical protein